MSWLFRVLAILPIMLSFPSSIFCSGTNPDESKIKISVDPRVELMSTIARLAEYDEYAVNKFPEYVREAQSYFGKYKDHDVVRFAHKLRETRKIGYDAVTGIAISVKDAYTLEEIIPLDSPQSLLDDRWTVDDARQFLKLARQFVAETNFREFISGHKALYDTAVARLTATLEQKKFADWINGFFGSHINSEFQILIGIQIGENNYGAQIDIPGKGKIIYSILGVSSADEKGFPVFNNWPDFAAVHELSHSYINPLVDKYESQSQPAGEKMYA